MSFTSPPLGPPRDVNRHHTGRVRRGLFPRSAPRPNSRVPRLEMLEGRALLSTFTVLSDADATTGPTLRAGIASGADKIVFALPSPDTIKLTLGELAITKSVDIEGPGANDLTVSGAGASRVFHIADGAAVTLSHLTIANGVAAQGGGVDNAGTLLITYCTLFNNQANGGSGGGGVLNEAKAGLTISHSSLTQNKAVTGPGADVFGGGLLNYGKATVTSSTFTANKALGGASSSFFGGSVGGGVSNFGGATLAVSDSKFVNNQAVGADGPSFGIGGAIENNSGFNVDRPSTATISNSTFIGNLATGGRGSTANGGALDNEGVGATMTLTNSTLANNRAVGGPGGDGVATLSQGIGGGLMNEAGIVTVTDSTILGNQAVGGDGTTPTLANPLTGGGLGGGVENFGLAGFFGGNAGGTLTVKNSTIAGNQALGGDTPVGLGGSGVGGGIENSFSGANLTVIDSTILGNRAVAGHGGPGTTGVPTGLGSGGGIDDSFNSTASVVNSILIGNSAVGSTGGPGTKGGDGWGGGIVVGINSFLGFPPDTSSLTVSGSTLTGNLAQGGPGGSGADGGNGLGGGLMMASATATATLDHSIIVANRALGGKGGAGGSDGQGIGGGVYITPDAVVRSKKSLINANFASTSNDNVFGTIVFI